MARLEAEITHIATAPPAAFLMLDLDHFKRVNDTWGHATGDKVLVHLANLLRGNLLRKETWLGRLGAREFAVLLPNTTVEQGHAIAERLRIALEQSTIASDDGQSIRVTMSVGLCPVLPDRHRPWPVPTRRFTRPRTPDATGSCGQTPQRPDRAL